MTEMTSGSRKLTGLSRINVLLGKNGCGKSVLLRELESKNTGGTAHIRYIAPERAGSLEYQAAVIQNLTNDSNWLPNERRRNMVPGFMQQSVGQFARIETLVLRRIEKDPKLRSDHAYSFDTYTVAVNGLLDHVELRRDEKQPFVLHRKDGTVAHHGQLSSGEAQLVALGIECLAFELDEKPGVENVLLLDEPDVHIHPDLQARLVKFLADIVARTKITVVMATHSTAILGALEANPDANVCFMRSGDQELAFVPISEGLKKILPIFGAHPLSNIFNEMPLLLVEGTDEERIWQQAVRSSNGQIRLYPCECGGLSKMVGIEKEADRIISSVYDKGVAYSLRDRDVGDGTIDHLGTVQRFRLQWRASENLLLTDDVLARWGSSWPSMQTAIADWVSKNPGHQAHGVLRKFIDDGFKRETADLKEARNVIAGLLNGSKSWEVLVGQTIGMVSPASYAGRGQAGSLHAALGSSFFDVVFR